jgi:hypothetical protein
VTEPIWVRTKAVAKALAAELALKVLEEESSDYHLPRLCDCSAKGSEVKSRADFGEAEAQEKEDFEEGDEGLVEDPIQKDETEEGFALLARGLVKAREGRSSGAATNHGESSDMDISEDEVEVR